MKTLMSTISLILFLASPLAMAAEVGETADICAGKKAEEKRACCEGVVNGLLTKQQAEIQGEGEKGKGQNVGQ